MSWRALALAVLLHAPAASAGFLWGESGIPVEPDCTTDAGGDQTMRPSGDGGMDFPGAGCTATFRVGNATSVAALRTHSSAQQGYACGFWQVTGGFTGWSELSCARQGGNATLGVDAVRGVGSRFNVTWWPTSWRHEDVVLCSLSVVGDGREAPPCQQGAPEGEAGPCWSGVTVAPAIDATRVTWPAQAGVARYNVTAVRLEAAPVLAAPADVTGAGAAMPLGAGDHMLVVLAFAGDGSFLGASCTARFTVPAGADVPFFPAGWAWGLGIGAVVVAGLVLRQRVS